MLAPTAFNRVLSGVLGQPIGWRKASSCPCVSPSSGAASPTCPICSGKGVFWEAEVEGVAGLSGQSQSKAMAQFGEWEPGDSLLTIPSSAPFYQAGRFDRFRAINSTERFSVVVDPDGSNRLQGAIVSLESVKWVSGGVLVSGDLPTVDATGAMTFASNGPPADKPFVVAGVRYVEFYAYLNLPVNRNVGTLGLPRKLPLRRFDLFGRTS